MRQLPPFGRTLAATLAAGRKPANAVFVLAGSDAWKTAKALSCRQPVLLLPSGANPSVYRWPVRGLWCLLVQKGESSRREVLELTRELLTEGAYRIVILATDAMGEAILTAGNEGDGKD